jgi:hypothetical protein
MRHNLVLMALVVTGVATPAWAQQGGQLPGAGATPDAVVARLMSFDTNHDGRIVRAELPERMQALFTRAETTKDGALDADEVRRLAQRPSVVVAPQGVQPGHYGFGDDFGLDTRLHIEGAIEDLRLASDTREKALGIGHRFLDTVDAQAKADVLAAAKPLLTAEQFADFTKLIEQPIHLTALPNAVVAQTPDGATRIVLSSGAGTPEAQVRALAQRLTLISQRVGLLRAITKYQLGPGEQQTLQAAIERFQAHDRFSDEERSALLGELRGVLTDQERDDLRAALERRPIIKQELGIAATSGFLSAASAVSAPN